MKVTFDARQFNKAYLPLIRAKQPLLHVYGGGSSGKSHTITTFAVLWALRGEAVLVARQTQTSLKKSVWLEVTKAIRRMKLKKHFRINKSEFFIECLKTGGSLQFVGCDDVEKIKSITPIHRDAFSKLWIEEASEVSRASLTQLRIRMRGKTPFIKQTFLTYNPIYKTHYLYKDYFEKNGIDDSIRLYETEELLILKTTYRDNRFLAQEEIDFLEGLKESSPYFFEVYAQGNFGTLGSRVFENWKEEHFNASDLKKFPLKIGGDFGFTIDPATTIFCRYDAKTKTIYIFDEIYKTGLTNDLLADAIKEKIVLNDLYKPKIYFDAAEPKSIRELQTFGLNATKATEAKKSILRGIDFLLQCKIVVHPRCKHTKEELQLYTRKEKNGEVFPEPIDKYNHLLDALRYGFEEEIGCFTGFKSGRSANLYN